MAYSSLHDRLRGQIATNIKKRLKRENIHALPRVEKIIVATGINAQQPQSKEMHEYIEECLKRITGQKPVFTKARKAISNFKIRQGLIVGAVVTLRGRRMEEFLDRLLSYALPRIRDFRGVPMKLDGHGNYCLGIKDHSIFPEVESPEANQIFGLQVQITTTAGNDEEGRALFEEMGMPFRKEKKEASKSIESEEKKPDTAPPKS